MSIERPPFELTPPEPPRWGERLTDADELAGMMILKVFDNCKDSDDVVIVTETRCWLVLHAEHDGGCDSAAYINVQRDQHRLVDFVDARDLLTAGCINHAEYTAYKAEEDARRQAQMKARAERLRREADMLDPKPNPPEQGTTQGEKP